MQEQAITSFIISLQIKQMPIVKDLLDLLVWSLLLVFTLLRATIKADA